MEVAIAEGRILVTHDLDFGRLYYFHRRGKVGILILRLSRLKPAARLERLESFLQAVDLEARGLQLSLVVVEPHRHRTLK